METTYVSSTSFCIARYGDSMYIRRQALSSPWKEWRGRISLETFPCTKQVPMLCFFLSCSYAIDLLDIQNSRFRTTCTLNFLFYAWTRNALQCWFLTVLGRQLLMFCTDPELLYGFYVTIRILYATPEMTGPSIRVLSPLSLSPSVLSPILSRYFLVHWYFSGSVPVFGIGGRFGGVKRWKALRVMFFCLRGLESYGEFFGPGASGDWVCVLSFLYLCGFFFFF